MNIFDDYTKELITTLQQAEVRFLIVGGYAVNYYGYVRTTGDIDLWLQPDNGENKKRFLQALLTLGIGKEVVAELDRLDFTQAHVFSDGEPPYRIDFLTKVSGIEFEEAWEMKTNANLDGLSLQFISLDHLILTKMSSSRHKDKADVDELQKIKKLDKPNR